MPASQQFLSMRDNKAADLIELAGSVSPRLPVGDRREPEQREPIADPTWI